MATWTRFATTWPRSTATSVASSRGPPRLDVPTPAPGWSISDQIAHLWFFERKALHAITDPVAFAHDAWSLLDAMAADGGRSDMSVVDGRTRPAEDLLAGWREDRAALVERAR